MSENKYICTSANESDKSLGIINSSLKHHSNLKKYIFNNLTPNNKLKTPSFCTRLSRFNNLSYNNRYYYKQPNFYNKGNLKSQIDILLTSLNFPNLETKNIINRNRQENSFNSITTEENTVLDSKKATIDTVLPILNTTIITNSNNTNTKSKILINGKNLSFSKKNTNKSLNYIDNSKKTNFSINNQKQNIRLINQPKKDVEYEYKCIFTEQPIFRKRRNQYLDNKLNLVYSENEEQYKAIMRRKSELMKNKDPTPKAGDDSEKIIQRVKDIKNKIKFMKCVMDYSYPDFILTKAQSMVKQFSNNGFRKNMLTPIESRNMEFKKKIDMRTNYLKRSLNITPLKITND